jgi:hypothetical protein
VLPTLELRPVVNAFKGNANLNPLVLDSSRNLNPSLIKGLKGGTSAALRHTVKPLVHVLHVAVCLCKAETKYASVTRSSVFRN